MRIFKYLYKEVMASFMAVAIILVFIFVSSRFVSYLADAASGRFSGEVVLSILLFRLPGFLELIFPLALFLAVMLAYGRLYVDSEMVVLQACGISKRRLLIYTQGSAMTVMLVVALISLYLTPLGTQKFDEIWNDPETYSGLGTLVAGSFKKMSGGASTVYVANLNQDKTAFDDVFIAQTKKSANGEFSIIRATSGKVINKGPNERYIELQDGQVVSGALVQKDFQFSFFERFGQRILVDNSNYVVSQKAEAANTLSLWSNPDPKAQASLQWRLALPFLAPIAAIIALALSETSHRRGRYVKILPGIILYILYLSLFLSVKSEIEKEQAHPWSLWAVHGVFLAVGLLLMYWPEIYKTLRPKRRLQANVVGA